MHCDPYLHGAKSAKTSENSWAFTSRSTASLCLEQPTELHFVIGLHDCIVGIAFGRRWPKAGSIRKPRSSQQQLFILHGAPILRCAWRSRSRPPKQRTFDEQSVPSINRVSDRMVTISSTALHEVNRTDNRIFEQGGRTFTLARRVYRGRRWPPSGRRVVWALSRSRPRFQLTPGTAL